MWDIIALKVDDSLLLALDDLRCNSVLRKGEKRIDIRSSSSIKKKKNYKPFLDKINTILSNFI